jgi:tetratricopeptide (TPR) repeat protein
MFWLSLTPAELNALPAILRFSFRHLLGPAALGGAMLTALAAGADTPPTTEPMPEMLPSPLGHYLASRFAQETGDLGTAVNLLGFALAADPDNIQLLRTDYNLMVSEGRMSEALAVAKRLEAAGALDGVARVGLAIDRAKAGDYAGADRYLDSIKGEGLERFLKPMLRAWTQLDLGGLAAAEKTLRPLGAVSGFEPLYQLQLGLLADNAGQAKEAGEHYAKAMQLASDQAFRMIEIVANFDLRQGEKKEALALYDSFDEGHPNNLLTPPLRKAAESGAKPQPLVATALDGMGEALFQLSVLLQTEASNDAALLLVRLALEAQSEDPIYQALLADTLDAQNRTAEALAAYRAVPADAPYGWQAQIKVGEELHRLGRDTEAVADLKKLVASRPDRSEAAIALGDILRGTKQFAGAVKAYDTAIERLGPARPEDWAVYYFRGIALERSGRWTLAEKDLKKALELQPDHPYVLNYLGYTWVDHGEHLKEAIKMLQKAVEQKPDDGFIVDSLAWAYYRLGQYDKAVIYQEKAVSLEPGDSVLNDHLGDIYWKVGRRNEARFQWQRALAFKPDADRVAPIEAKLQHGLEPNGSGG